MEKIEKCPFCGGEAAWAETDDNGEYIACIDPLCGVSSRVTYSIKADGRPIIIAAWNRRAETEALRAAVADLAWIIKEKAVTCSQCGKPFNDAPCGITHTHVLGIIDSALAAGRAGGGGAG